MPVNFNEKLKQISSILNGVSGDSGVIEGSKLESEALSLESKMTDKFIEKLQASILEIAEMRSSYLPISIYTSGDKVKEAITDSRSELESYENAFMRMLGMPSSNFVMKSGKNLSLMILDPNGVPIQSAIVGDNAAVDDILIVLDERMKKRDERRVVIDNKVFNLTNNPISIPLDGIAVNDLKISELSPSLETIDSNFFKFSYLLLPPVQDSRVSSCLNEHQKMTAPLFGSRGSSRVNNTRLKQTLLEAIIRIRLDRMNNKKEVSDGTSLIQLDSDAYNILEALFVSKLDIAISGMSIKIKKEIDDLITKRFKELKETSEVIPSSDETSSGGNLGTTIVATNSNIKKQIFFENAVLSLLGDDSEVLDLQIQTQRNSGVRTAHLMSSLLGAIDLKRTRLEQEIIKSNEKQVIAKTPAKDAVLPPRDRIALESTLGTNTGIGNVDIIAFSIGMFMMSESGLIGLLEDSAFERLSNLQEFSGYDFSGKSDVVSSLNELSEYVYAVYESFSQKLQE